MLQVGFIMTSFEKIALVKGFIGPGGITMISRYMENALHQEHFERITEKTAMSYGTYGDPLIELVLADMLPVVEGITGKELLPTYSFARVYVKGDVLRPHKDRPACEYSVTVNVATVGELWPIWMDTSKNEPEKYVLMSGDAVVYKGCEVEHWRETATDTEINVQFMLHYVDKNGPFSELKFDNRDKLGQPFKTEG